MHSSGILHEVCAPPPAVVMMGLVWPYVECHYVLNLLVARIRPWLDMVEWEQLKAKGECLHCMWLHAYLWLLAAALHVAVCLLVRAGCCTACGCVLTCVCWLPHCSVYRGGTSRLRLCIGWRHDC